MNTYTNVNLIEFSLTMKYIFPCFFGKLFPHYKSIINIMYHCQAIIKVFYKSQNDFTHRFLCHGEANMHNSSIRWVLQDSVTQIKNQGLQRQSIMPQLHIGHWLSVMCPKPLCFY